MKSILLLLLTLAPAIQAAAGKPDIVLIVADDSGCGDIGPFGSAKNRTPNLERLAAEGGKLHGTIRRRGASHSLPTPVPQTGKLVTEASFASDETLPPALDGRVSARGKSPGLIARPPAGNSAHSHDNKTPAADRQGAGPFEGKISLLKISIL